MFLDSINSVSAMSKRVQHARNNFVGSDLSVWGSVGATNSNPWQSINIGDNVLIAGESSQNLGLQGKVLKIFMKKKRKMLSIEIDRNGGGRVVEASAMSVRVRLYRHYKHYEYILISRFHKKCTTLIVLHHSLHQR